MKGARKEAREGGWLSAHLHFEGDLYGPDADRLLWGLVVPQVRGALDGGAADRWFFLRFNQPSDHLRLRLRVPSEPQAAQLRERIEVAFLEFRRQAGNPPVTELHWIDYEPELDRYGGPTGVALAEELFHRSSEMALALLLKMEADDRPARLGKALLAMLVLIHGYTPERSAAAAFCRSYGHGYLRSLVPDPQLQEHWLTTFEAGFERQASGLSQYLEVAWKSLVDEGELTPELDLYRRQMSAHGRRLRRAWEAGQLIFEGKPYPTWATCFGHIVPSYLHMMNNRLGISQQEESYLSVLFDWTLRRSGGVPTLS